MLLTVPIGKDAIHVPDHRVYGSERLQKLLSGFFVIEQEFWIKNDHNQWIPAKEGSVLRATSSHHHYGLGCFVLKK